jgi:hypothetical protein
LVDGTESLVHDADAHLARVEARGVVAEDGAEADGFGERGADGGVALAVGRRAGAFSGSSARRGFEMRVVVGGDGASRCARRAPSHGRRRRWNAARTAVIIPTD